MNIKCQKNAAILFREKVLLIQLEIVFISLFACAHEIPIKVFGIFIPSQTLYFLCQVSLFFIILNITNFTSLILFKFAIILSFSVFLCLDLLLKIQLRYLFFFFKNFWYSVSVGWLSINYSSVGRKSLG